MYLRHQASPDGVAYVLIDDAEQPVPVVSNFLRFLAARNLSPNTVKAYAYDLLHFWRFLQHRRLTFREFTPPISLEFLVYLRELPQRPPTRRFDLTLCSVTEEGAIRGLSAATVNRVFAAVSSFYEYLILAGQWSDSENPLTTVADPGLARVPTRHQPFLGRSSRQRPMRRTVHVKTVQRVPRPVEEAALHLLFASLTCWRDRAMLWLLLQGGLRPGELLNLHLEDIHYGRRRITIRHREDHPRGVRTKSRQERVVDLHEPEALPILSRYIMEERPQEADTTLIFLVGGHGKRRCEPLSYHALVKMFARHCERVGIRSPWMTPHALRHTHATRMWEGGMRELTLQKRLGHASPESTRLYTRVPDPMVVAEYHQALGQRLEQEGEQL